MIKTIRLRLSEVLLAEIDSALVKHHNKSGTEFILDDIRSKLSEFVEIPSKKGCFSGKFLANAEN